MRCKHGLDRSRRSPEQSTDSARWGRRELLTAGAATALTAALPPAALAQALHAAGDRPTRFQRIPTQFIAALGEPDATSGDNAHEWGLWRLDPGPRGVSLAHYDRLRAEGVAPARWTFDADDWWLEEHGLIMEAPEFPLPPGSYMVTGNRDVKSVLTVQPADAAGRQRWALADGATIYDVTHLRCRSARYRPAGTSGSCSPAKASLSAFPVAPGAPMPPVQGCDKLDYAVLIVIGIAADSV